jgi:hypothetical protein
MVMRSGRRDAAASLFFSRYSGSMQINLDKKSGLLFGIIVGLLVIIIVLLVDKVEDDGNMVETNIGQVQIGS